MARTRYDEPDDEEYEDEEEPDWDTGDDYDPDDPETYPPGLYDDDGPAMVPCPHCKAEIIEDSERCPECGAFISREDTESGGMSVAIAVLMIFALLATVIWVIG